LENKEFTKKPPHLVTKSERSTPSFHSFKIPPDLLIRRLRKPHGSSLCEKGTSYNGISLPVTLSLTCPGFPAKLTSLYLEEPA